MTVSLFLKIPVMTVSLFPWLTNTSYDSKPVSVVKNTGYHSKPVFMVKNTGYASKPVSMVSNLESMADRTLIPS